MTAGVFSLISYAFSNVSRRFFHRKNVFCLFPKRLNYWHVYVQFTDGKVSVRCMVARSENRFIFPTSSLALFHKRYVETLISIEPKLGDVSNTRYGRTVTVLVFRVDSESCDLFPENCSIWTRRRADQPIGWKIYYRLYCSKYTQTCKRGRIYNWCVYAILLARPRFTILLKNSPKNTTSVL